MSEIDEMIASTRKDIKEKGKRTPHMKAVQLVQYSISHE